MTNSFTPFRKLKWSFFALLNCVALLGFGQAQISPQNTPIPQFLVLPDAKSCPSVEKTFEVKPQIFEKKKKNIEQKALWSIEREQFEYDMLKDPNTGTIPRNAPALALQAAKQTKQFVVKSAINPGDVTITPRGPNNLGGRTRAIVFDKRNANIIIAGGVSSGVFRSTNGGTSWTRVTPIGQIHNVTAIAQDPRPGFEDTWYYGTGESIGNSASLGSAYRGNGIWKSTDNGLTWSVLPSTTMALESFDSAFDYVHRIIVNPLNGDVYAAASNTIQRSTNGGTSWTTVLGTLANANYTDVVITSAGRLYAAIDGRESIEGVWTSLTGNTGGWTKIAGTISSVVTPATWNAFNTYGRIVLTTVPSDSTMIYALYWRGTTSSCTGVAAPEAKLFKYDRGTTTWTDLSANLPDEAGCSNGNDPFAVQTGYDLVVTVKPDDANTVFIGGTNLYRSTNGFTSTAATTRIGGYASASNYALYTNHHPDQHVAVFAPGDNNTLYSGNDGGIHKADITNPTVTWTSLNNDYVTYQYYHVDIDPLKGSTALMGGAQDNGTTTVNTGTSFSSVFGADGCATGIISYTNTSNYNAIVTSQLGSVFRLIAPSNGWFIRPTGLAASIFVTYLNLDQDNRNYLYFVGGSVLYRTRVASTITGNNTTGTPVGNPMTGWDIIPAGIVGDIRSMATSRNDAYSGNAYTVSDANRKLYIGTSGGRIYRLNDPAFTTSAAVNITPLAPIASSGICSSIAVNPENDNEIIATFSNYGVNSVYHTLNANAATPTWTVVEGPTGGAVTLGSARSSIITPIGMTKTYFVGNSTGLYATQILSGNTTVWEKIGTNDINYALCSQIRLRTSDNKMVVGTHGNGMYELQLPVGPTINTQPMAASVCDGNNTSFSVAATGATSYQWQISNDMISSNFTNLTIAPPYSLSGGGTTLNITGATAGLNGKYYRCVVTNATGYTNSTGVLLTVGALLSSPTAVAVNANVACSGSAVTLTGTCATGTITWYNQAMGGIALGTGNNFAHNPTTNTTYYASCENGICPSSSRVATNLVTVSTLSMSPLNITTDLTMGTSFQITTQNITATNKISTGASATYRAGTNLSLDTGFEANVGSLFLAEIRGCN